VYLEHLVVPDEFCDHFIYSVVELNVLLFLVVFVFEYRERLLWCLLEVLLHVEEKFKKQLGNAEVLADHLLHL
jgi:hypothetical protein